MSDRCFMCCYVQNKILMLCVALLCTLFFPPVLQAAETTELETVKLQLKWKHGFQFAGYYAAIEKGYYLDAGLNVELYEHDGKRSSVDVLLESDADYSVTGSQIVLHRAQGKPVVVLATIFQHSPYAFLVKADSGIKRVEDFKGKRVMMLDDGIDSAELLATLRRAGLDKSDYKYIPTSFDPFSLVRGEADVFNAYVTNQGFALDEAGIGNRFILPNQYGVDFYGDVLVTTEDEINNNPERVQAFLKATLKGWEYSQRHPDEIIDLVIENYNTQNYSREHLKYSANVSRELIQPLLVKIGYMNPARWEHIKNIFEELDFLPPESNIEGMIYQQKNNQKTYVQWIIDYWLTLVALFVFLFILVLLFFTFQLRHQVKKRTEDLQESEQYWRALINAEPACVKTLNEKGELISMNAAGLAMIDVDDIEQVRGAEVFKLVDEKYREDFVRLGRKVFEGQSGTLLFKAQGLKGRVVWLETHAVPFRDNKGSITRQLAVTQDVTERVESDKEKEYMQQELQVSQKMEALGRLTGGIAHDFNNLLAIIVGYSDLAMLNHAVKKEPKLARYLQNIQDASERAKNLIEQMLAFSRGDGTEIQPVKLHSLIKEDIKMLRSALPSSIEIQADIQEDLPAVTLNPTQLNQVLMNLSINARDAMDGQGRLTIRLALAEDVSDTCAACLKTIRGDWVDLSITDTGTGIDPEILKDIFHPFFTTKEVGKGSGMGLSVIYGILIKCGAHVFVETEKGIGTTFRILFPPSLTDQEKPDELCVSEGVLSRGNGEHILIVDDGTG